jgi:hypothetical protein
MQLDAKERSKLENRWSNPLGVHAHSTQPSTRVCFAIESPALVIGTLREDERPEDVPSTPPLRPAVHLHVPTSVASRLLNAER